MTLGVAESRMPSTHTIRRGLGLTRNALRVLAPAWCSFASPMRMPNLVDTISESFWGCTSMPLASPCGEFDTLPRTSTLSSGPSLWTGEPPATSRNDMGIFSGASCSCGGIGAARTLRPGVRCPQATQTFIPNRRHIRIAFIRRCTSLHRCSCRDAPGSVSWLWRGS